MSIETALRNYRIAAWVTGVGLLVLVVVAMPLKYVFGQPQLVSIVGVAHGFLYMIFLLAALDLARRSHWQLPFAALILVLGTVPVLSFVAERMATRKVHELARSEAPV